MIESVPLRAPTSPPETGASIDRLNFIYQDMVPSEEVVPRLANVFRYYRDERKPGESLGDFCHRKGKDDLLAHCELPAEVV